MMANYPYYNPYLQNGYQYASAPAQNQNSIIWVNGDKEASAYPVAPNNAVALWDSENPTIYLKQADASGRPSIKVFDLVERTAKEETSADYATKADITAVMRSLSDMKADLEGIKNDVYGLAGKKRKKGEDDE